MYASGALNPDSLVGYKEAEKLYSMIRKRQTDCLNIAHNSGFTIEQCTVIKNYLFNDRHLLETGYITFLPDLAIAQSWIRLSENKGKNIQQHDIVLLYHELKEITLLLNNPSLEQYDAHLLAER